jgi:hypothetical protein
VLVWVVLFAVLLASVRFFVRRAVARTEAAASTVERRRQSLMSTAEELLVDVPAGAAIHGAAMEATSAAATLTIVAYADGDAHLLMSNGPVITAGAQYAKVREAAKLFVAAVVSHAGNMQKGKSRETGLPPFPAVGETRVYALTASGPLLVTVPPDVEQLGDRLIATLRSAEARRA